MEIIVAEDHPVSAKLIEKILQRAGHTAIPARDGMEAWELLTEKGYRMVLTDWMMPRMDGISLCQKVRKANLTPYVYMILLTARANISDTVKGLEAGADDYIVKPVDPEELNARIRVGIRHLSLEDRYEKTSQQLMQAEKMASLGQLAAGVAHEINNPIGFVGSNLKTLGDYTQDLHEIISGYIRLAEAISPLPPPAAEIFARIRQKEADCDLPFLLGDIHDLIMESREGVERVRKIVADLKTFAHPGKTSPEISDINQCIASTLNVLGNEIKYRAEIVREFGTLPMIPCFPQQLNQVFLGILVNAVQAMDEKGEIRITTADEGDTIRVSIADTGAGIPKENLSRIFDPFFTTKPVGMGTGLGLNVAYNIIRSHQGTITVESLENIGTTFHIRLPVHPEPLCEKSPYLCKESPDGGT